MNEQELSVMDVLKELDIPYVPHKVFDLGPLGFISVDFFVGFSTLLSRRSGHSIVIECTYTASRQGKALSQLRRRAVWMNWKFTQLRSRTPSLVCIALIEAQQVGSDLLTASIGPFLTSANHILWSVEGLRDLLMRIEQ